MLRYPDHSRRLGDAIEDHSYADFSQIRIALSVSSSGENPPLMRITLKQTAFTLKQRLDFWPFKPGANFSSNLIACTSSYVTACHIY